MNMVLLNLFVLSLFLMSMTTIAALRSRTSLGATTVVLTLSGPLLGAQAFSVNGYTTNVGNIFFGCAMFGLSLACLVYGLENARKATFNILFGSVVLLGALFLLERAHLLSVMFNPGIRLAGARVFAFSLAQSFFLTLLHRFSRNQSVWSIGLITVAMQTLDSAVYFPCAFLDALPLKTVLEFAATGWLTRLVVAIISLPFLAVSLRFARSRDVAVV